MRAGIAREWLREVRSISYAEQDLLARGAGNCLREVRVLGLARGQREVRSISYAEQDLLARRAENCLREVRGTHSARERKRWGLVHVEKEIGV